MQQQLETIHFVTILSVFSPLNLNEKAQKRGSGKAGKFGSKTI